MNKFYLRIIKICPIFSLLFSLITVVTTTAINENRISPIFVFFCVQVYLNWVSINRISRATATITIPNESDLKSAKNNRYDVQIQIQSNDRSTAFRGLANDLPSITVNDKLWYCEKCNTYTSRPSRHCGLCKKCFHYRDHHCFFIGSCILRQNMGNFILICVYTSFSSIYSLTILAPYLYEHLDHFLGDKSSAFDIVLNFSFPVALARFLLSSQESCIMLVTLFDALFSISCICLMYGLWKLYTCLTGRQRYFPHTHKKHDLAEIFGSYGLCNFIFPINGLLRAKSLPQKYDLWKEI